MQITQFLKTHSTEAIVHIRSERGPLVLEVNSSPGFEGVENVTGVDVAGKIIEFIEKPPHPLPINIGYYMINKQVIEKNYKKNFELEIDFLPLLAKKNLLISSEHNGYFYSINDKKEFLNAKKNLKNL